MKTMGILAAAAACLLAGCATTPTPLSEATPVPAARVLAFQAPTPDAATVVVTRDSGLMGSGCYVGLRIDRQLAARIGHGETVTFHVKPGATLFRVGRDPQGRGLCSTGQDNWTERQIVLAPDSIEHFRLSYDANGKADIEPSD